MVFSKPVLNTYEATDTNYITKLNNDNTALDNAFSGIQGDINTLQTNTGTAVFEELTRKGPSAESWPDGVFGAYSLEFSSTNIGSGSLTLKSTNEDQISVVVLNGERRQHAGDLDFDLTTLSLNNGNHDVFLGVTSSGDFDFVAQASTTQSSVTVPLYKVPITVSSSGTAFALSLTKKPSRLSRTVYWDNTIEQLRQETPQIIHVHITNTFSLSIPDSTIPRFTIPFDHYFDGITMHSNEVSNGGSITANTRKVGSTYSVATGTLSNSSGSATGVNQNLTLLTSSPNANEVAFAANTAYEINLTSLSGTISGLSFSIFVRRAYNAPLWT